MPAGEEGKGGAGGPGRWQSQVEPQVPCLSQLLDLPTGPRGPQHAASVAAGGEGPAADDRGGGGQLPRDPGPAAHRACAPRIPGAMDAGEMKSQSGAAVGESSPQ